MIIGNIMSIEDLIDYMWNNGKYNSSQYEDNDLDSVLEDGCLMFENKDATVTVGFDKIQDKTIKITCIQIEK